MKGYDVYEDKVVRCSAKKYIPKEVISEIIVYLTGN